MFFDLRFRDEDAFLILAMGFTWYEPLASGKNPVFRMQFDRLA
jgi:hypothetical protein